LVVVAETTVPVVLAVAVLTIPEALDFNQHLHLEVLETRVVIGSPLALMEVVVALEVLEWFTAEVLDELLTLLVAQEHMPRLQQVGMETLDQFLVRSRLL
jgi:hypothetical protein